MTEPNKPPAELLAQALESLPPDERKRVTAWVLSRMSGGYLEFGTRIDREAVLRGLRPEPSGFRADLHALYTQPFASTGLAGGQAQQVVPVRLPAELHGRLRRWSTDHGFSMATVVRGLVARFLDGQGVAPEPESGPATTE